MKQWTVYYRDKNGSKASVVIEAEDRAGVFVELKKRGISAISVTEGASNKKPRKAASSGAPSKVRGLIAAAIVVVLGVVAVWFMMPREEKGVVKKIEKIAATDKVRVPAKNVKKDQSKKLSKEDEREKTKILPVVQDYPRTNADGRVVKRLKSGEIYTVLPRSKDWKKKYPFQNSLESQLSWYAIPGAEVPPLLPIRHTEQDIVNALTRKIKINEDDDDETVIMKESVQELKENLKQWIKEGGTVDDYIRQLARRQALEADEVNMSRKKVMETLEGGDVELAKELSEKLNQRMAEKGLPSVRLPRKYRELMENNNKEIR